MVPTMPPPAPYHRMRPSNRGRCDDLIYYLLGNALIAPGTHRTNHQRPNIMARGIYLMGNVGFNRWLMRAVILFLVSANIFRMHSSLQQQQGPDDGRRVDDHAPRTGGNSLSSGVGIVTADGAWGGDDGKHASYDGQDVKILGFTDRNYLPVAKLWYSRLSILVRGFFSARRRSDLPLAFAARPERFEFLHLPSQGYTEHYVVANDA